MTYMLSSLSRCHYSILFVVLLPFILLRLLWRSIKAPAYRQRVMERVGVFSVPAAWAEPSTIDDASTIVFHAVSVGEVMAVLPVVKRLLITQPSVRCVVTCSTPTGSAQIQQRLAQEIEQGRLLHVYLPYDVPLFVNAFLSRVNPALLVIVETELWPNLLSACQRRGINTALMNARLSEKSCASYAKVERLTHDMMSDLDLLLAQDAASLTRFQSLGVSSLRSDITGNVKFDVPITSEMKALASEIKTRMSSDQRRPVLIAGSTHLGEDDIVFEAFRTLLNQVDDEAVPRLVIVPRHPERFGDVYELASSLGFDVTKYSQLMDRDSALADEFGDVVVVDEMGQLLMLYGAADVALVCGSLLPSLGGHNLLEPAVWGVPVLSGEGVFNFQSVSDEMVACQALTLVANAEALSRAWSGFIDDADHARQAGEAAQQYVLANQGAVERTLSALNSLLSK